METCEILGIFLTFKTNSKNIIGPKLIIISYASVEATLEKSSLTLNLTHIYNLFIRE